MLVGVLLCNTTESADDRVRDVQINNEQLYDQLRTAHTVGGLILNTSEHTFAFNSSAADGTLETCTGKYEVQHNQAHVIGDLACTQTVAVQPS